MLEKTVFTTRSSPLPRSRAALTGLVTLLLGVWLSGCASPRVATPAGHPADAEAHAAHLAPLHNTLEAKEEGMPGVEPESKPESEPASEPAKPKHDH